MDLGIPVFRNYELFKLVIAESTWVMLKIFTFYDTVKLNTHVDFAFVDLEYSIGHHKSLSNPHSKAGGLRD